MTDLGKSAKGAEGVKDGAEAAVPAQKTATAAAGTNGNGNGNGNGAAPGAIPAVDPRLLVREQGFAGYLNEFKRKMRGGELGAVPVVCGLIIIWGIFEFTTGRFLDPNNLSNISQYIVGPGLISVGIVFVLLLGEIDLSVGSVAGVTAAISSVLAIKQGVNEGLAVLLGLLAAAAIGAVHGFFFAKIGVPAFVVTLAGMLGWQGLQLHVLGDTLSLNNLSEGVVYTLNNYYFEDIAVAYGLATVGVAAILLTSLRERARRKAVDLPHRTMSEIVVRTVVLGAVLYAAAWVYNQYKGLPLGITIFVGIVVSTSYVLRRTNYGRQIFAVGGGIEAARRAGINVAWIRISVFTISGFLAGLGGLFIASQSGVADSTLGGGNTLPLVIAAAVIGGTSLFGGRGTPWSALLGILVIQSIITGLYMNGSSSQAMQYMITGAVLLGAVVLDSVSRRTQKSSGRA